MPGSSRRTSAGVLGRYRDLRRHPLCGIWQEQSTRVQQNSRASGKSTIDRCTQGSRVLQKKVFAGCGSETVAGALVQGGRNSASEGAARRQTGQLAQVLRFRQVEGSGEIG